MGVGDQCFGGLCSSRSRVRENLDGASGWSVGSSRRAHRLVSQCVDNRMLCVQGPFPTTAEEAGLRLTEGCVQLSALWWLMVVAALVCVQLSCGCDSSKQKAADSIPCVKVCRLLAGHSKPVQAVVFSADGRFVVSAGGEDSTIRVWDVVTGVLKLCITVPGAFVYDVAVSPDGELLLAGGSDGLIGVWRLHDGHEIKRISLKKTEKHSFGASSVDFSPDGRFCLATYADGFVHILDSRSWLEVSRMGPRRRGVEVARFSGDGNRVLAVSDGALCLWDCLSGEEVWHTDRLGIRVMTSATRGCAFVSGDWDGVVRMHACTDASQGQILKSFGYWVSAVSVSPDGAMIAASIAQGGQRRVKGGCSPSEGATIQLWAASSGRDICRFDGQSDNVSCLSFSPDGRFLVTGSWDHTVRLWEVPSSQPVK